jgi:transposase-like protein
LHQSGYVAVFIDGIYLGKAAVVVAALGITAEGNKEVLDFEQGCSESADICATLLTRLKDRGMVFAGRPLFVIDGSTALKNGIRKVFAKALIQRCLVHLERNVQKYLSHKHYGKLAEFFRKLRNAQGGNEGRVALLNLKLFLKCVNHKAYECVRSVGAEAIMVHLLNVPNSLHTTFLSTNNIENIFSSARRKMARVKRWDLKTNMIERWTAYALNDAESGFRRIGGYRELPALIDALQKVR